MATEQNDAPAIGRDGRTSLRDLVQTCLKILPKFKPLTTSPRRPMQTRSLRNCATNRAMSSCCNSSRPSSDSGQRVLDLGCGPGHTTAHLAALGLRPLGVDLSPQNDYECNGAISKCRLHGWRLLSAPGSRRLGLRCPRILLHRSFATGSHRTCVQRDEASSETWRRSLAVVPCWLGLGPALIIS